MKRNVCILYILVCVRMCVYIYTVCVCVCVCVCCCVSCAVMTLWTVACQAPLSTGFSRQE